MRRTVEALVSDPEMPSASQVPPEVELTSPQWYEQVDPARPSFPVTGEVFARGEPFTCRVLVAPGHYPNNAEVPNGDYSEVPSNGVCDGTTEHTDALTGKLADLSVAALKSRFPPDTNATGFEGREPGAGVQTSSGRPNTDPYGFVVKVVATTESDGLSLTGEDQRAAFLHRDQDMLEGFPWAITRGGQVSDAAAPAGDGESSPAFADLDGDNRNELIFATTDGFVHALRPDGTELPGWPVRGELPGFVSSHSSAQAFRSGAVSDDLGGAILAAVAIADANHDGRPEVYAADLEGRVYGWNDQGERVFEQESNPDFSGAPLPGQQFVENRRGETNRTQHGFIGSPVLADIDRNDGGRLEIVAAAMDRHLYAWNHNGSEVPGFPVLVVDPTKVASVDPVTHRVTFNAGSGSEQQGAIIDTPAVGDLDGDEGEEGPDERPEIVVGTNEEYDADADGGVNAGKPNATSLSVLDQVRAGVEEFKSECGDPCDALDIPISPGNSRLYAIYPDGEQHEGDGDAFLPSWPARIGILTTGLLPVVGEGISGAPVIASASCSPGGSEGPKIGASANNGPLYVLEPNGSSCYGKDEGQRDIPVQTDFSASATQFDRPAIPALGHPAFGDLAEPSPSILAPAAGLVRALDVAIPEYQRSQDFVGAWSVEGGGQFRPGFPSPVNDLQFLTGPSVADIGGTPGEEIIAGTASKDLTALNQAGLPANPSWPKLTTDWTVANPLIGSFGTVDTEGDARKVVVGMTRSGYVNSYSTEAAACSPGSWPRFHHDNANSGYFGRDAVLPGKPSGVAVSDEGDSITFTAPGDDLMCATADRYEVVTSDDPITAQNFDQAEPLAGAPDPAEPGTEQSYSPPAEARRYVAIRAVDDQGNVGRPASLDFLGPGPPPPGACANLIPGATSGPDVLEGTPRGDRIATGAGADRVFGRAGDDCLRGQGGPDKLSGGPDDDHVNGGRGRDRELGGSGDDVIHSGGRGRDVVKCGPGEDRAKVSRRDRVTGCEEIL